MRGQERDCGAGSDVIDENKSDVGSSRCQNCDCQEQDSNLGLSDGLVDEGHLGDADDSDDANASSVDAQADQAERVHDAQHREQNPVFDQKVSTNFKRPRDSHDADHAAVQPHDPERVGHGRVEHRLVAQRLRLQALNDDIDEDVDDGHERHEQGQPNYFVNRHFADQCCIWSSKKSSGADPIKNFERQILSTLKFDQSHPSRDHF